MSAGLHAARNRLGTKRAMGLVETEAVILHTYKLAEADPVMVMV